MYWVRPFVARSFKSMRVTGFPGKEKWSASFQQSLSVCVGCMSIGAPSHLSHVAYSVVVHMLVRTAREPALQLKRVSLE